MNPIYTHLHAHTTQYHMDDDDYLVDLALYHLFVYEANVVLYALGLVILIIVAIIYLPQYTRERISTQVYCLRQFLWVWSGIKIIKLCDKQLLVCI